MLYLIRDIHSGALSGGGVILYQIRDIHSGALSRGGVNVLPNKGNTFRGVVREG